jgi:hypothetical protein
MRKKRLKKTENLYFIIIYYNYLCNHQRVSATKLLKSLNPIVESLLICMFVLAPRGPAGYPCLPATPTWPSATLNVI